VNDYVDKKFTSVKYSSFDNAINMIKNLGVNALIGKKDSNQLFPETTSFLWNYANGIISN
jgi:hypothetical protein